MSDDRDTALPEGASELASLSSDATTRGALKVAAWGIAVASVAARVFWLSGTWFKDDDLGYRFKAYVLGFDLSYLFTRHDGHLMPGALSIVWLFERLFGDAWWPVMLWSAALQGLTAWLVVRVLTALVGRREAVLLALILVLWNPLTLDSTMWWAAGMQFLPLQAGMWALLAILVRHGDVAVGVRDGRPSWRWHQHPSARTALLAAMTLLVVLAFSEKAFLLVPFLFLVSLATPLGAHAGDTTRARLRHSLPIFAALAAASVAWFVVYLNSNSNLGRVEPGTPAEVAKTAWNMVTHSILPSLLGGPWSWTPVGPSGMLVQASSGAAVLAGSTFISVVTITSLRRPRVLWLWGSAALYLCLSIAGLRALRIGVLGSLTGLVPRYASDVVSPLVLVISIAVLGNRHEPADSSGAATRTQIPRASRRPYSWLTPLGCAIVVVSSLVSSSRLVAIAANAPALAYSRAALSSLDGRELDVFAQPAPFDVINPLLHPLNTSQTILEPLGAGFRFVESTPSPYIIDDRGRAVAAEVSGIKMVADASCLVELIDSTPKEVQLPGEAWFWDWYASIRFRSNADTSMVIVFGTTTRTVEADTNAGRVDVSLPGSGDTVTLTAIGGSLCVTELRIGTLVPSVTP